MTMRMHVSLAVSAGTGEVQLPREHYTLGGNTIRGAGTGDLFREHREEHQTQKRWDYQKQKTHIPVCLLASSPQSKEGEGTMMRR